MLFNAVKNIININFDDTIGKDVKKLLFINEQEAKSEILHNLIKLNDKQSKCDYSDKLQFDLQMLRQKVNFSKEIKHRLLKKHNIKKLEKIETQDEFKKIFDIYYLSALEISYEDYIIGRIIPLGGEDVLQYVEYLKLTTIESVSHYVLEMKKDLYTPVITTQNEDGKAINKAHLSRCILFLVEELGGDITDKSKVAKLIYYLISNTANPADMEIQTIKNYLSADNKQPNSSKMKDMEANIRKLLSDVNLKLDSKL